MDQQADSPIIPTSEQPEAKIHSKTDPRKIYVGLIVCVFIIIVVSIISYFLIFSQKTNKQNLTTLPSQTYTIPSITPINTDWKVLNSTFCGVSVAYPPDWTGNITEKNSCLLTMSGPIEKTTDMETYFSISSYDGSEWSNMLSGLQNKNPKTITIAGVEGIELQYDSDTEVNGIKTPDSRAIYINKGNEVLAISFTGDLASPQTQQTYNQMIRSIQFTKEPDYYNNIKIDKDFGSKWANDAIRDSDVKALLNAIYQYRADNNVLPSGIKIQPEEIKKGGADICSQLVPTYIASLSVDPRFGRNREITDCDSSYNTSYVVSKKPDGSVTVSTPHAELKDEISATAK